MFSGTAGTVNINANVEANALRFEPINQTPNYVIASTGGAVNLTGGNPTITVNLPLSSDTVTITAPLTGTNGLRIAGNSLSGGLKFLILANTSETAPNSFSGTLAIDAGGALRIGGGPTREQIPDNVDLTIAGVIDFITAGGASDMKQERVRDVSVTGSNAIFSVGNGTDFIVNSITGNQTENISVNGNQATVPGKLSITGWSAGGGNLTLNTSRVKLNTTSATNAIGGRVVLSGNIYSSGDSRVINNNGNAASVNTNTFTHKAFDFAGANHTVDVADSTLTFTSASAMHPLQITSLNPGGTTISKTGAGTWLWEHAVQSSFTGVTRVENGVLRIGASERLADGADLQVAGGIFDLQGFLETVHGVLLAGGTIAGTPAAALMSATDFQVQSGLAEINLSGPVGLIKSTASTATVEGSNTYAGTTTINDGLLLINGSHAGGGNYSVAPAGKLGGVGSISSSVVAEGIIAPGESVGTLTIGNDITMRSGSSLAIELSGATADKIVAHDLNLSENQSIDITTIAPLMGQSWLVAEYSGARTGVFDHVTAGYAMDYSVPGQLIVRLAPLPGDLDWNGRVDVSDYVVWRNGLDQLYNQNDYELWRANFGNTILGGTGSNPNTSKPVPEPGVAALALATGASLAWSSVRRRRGRAVSWHQVSIPGLVMNETIPVEI